MGARGPGSESIPRTARHEENEFHFIDSRFEEGAASLAAEDFDVLDGGGIGGEESRGEPWRLAPEGFREAQDRDRAVEPSRIDHDVGVRASLHARILSRR